MANWVLRVGETIHELGASELRVGRGSDGQVVLSGAGVSRKHALIRADATGVTVTDLESSHGTWVRGVRIEGPTLCKHGDFIKIGDHSLVVLDRSRVERAALPTIEARVPKKQP